MDSKAYSLVLNDNLLASFYAFKRNGEYDVNQIQNLLHYYKPPFITNCDQLTRIGFEDRNLMQKLAQSDLRSQSLSDLCFKTRYKIILSDKDYKYPYVNIYGDELENNFSSTYQRNVDRSKAQEYIKSLLEQAEHIFIYDKYITEQWQLAKSFFKNLLPKKKLTIAFTENHLKGKESEIKRICHLWKIKPIEHYKQYSKLHDRYLLIDDEVELILTSGFDNLFDTGKDFSFLLRVNVPRI